MKFCLYEIVDAINTYQRNDGEIDGAALATYLSELFNVEVDDMGLFEATFVEFCNQYCG